MYIIWFFHAHVADHKPDVGILILIGNYIHPNDSSSYAFT